jgi:hypothetical protein
MSNGLTRRAPAGHDDDEPVFGIGLRFHFANSTRTK